MILILYLTLLYKTMGGGSWNGLWVSTTNDMPQTTETYNSSSVEQPSGNIETGDNSDARNRVEEIEEAVQVITGQFSLAWQSLKHVSRILQQSFTKHWQFGYITTAIPNKYPKFLIFLSGFYNGSFPWYIGIFNLVVLLNLVRVLSYWNLILFIFSEEIKSCFVHINS